jgi:hypothetical protein
MRRHTHNPTSKTRLVQLGSMRCLWPAVYPIVLEPFVHAVCRRTVPPVRGLGERL